MLKQFLKIQLQIILITILFVTCISSNNDNEEDNKQSIDDKQAEEKDPSEDKKPNDNSKIEYMKGLYWMSGLPRNLEVDEKSFNNYLANFEKNIKANTHLSGVHMAIRWIDFEPERSQYAFERLDKIISKIHETNLKYKLILVPGTAAPDFIYSLGAQEFLTKDSNKYHSTYGEDIRIPLPWDETYQELFFEAVAELAKHYADDDHLIAVGITIVNFMSPEMHLPHSDADMQKWSQYSNHEALIESSWKKGIDTFAKLFPNKQLCIELTKPMTGMDDEVDRIIKYGLEKYPNRFTIQSDQLNGRNNNQNLFSYQKIMEYADQLHNGFQNVAGWHFPQAAERQGSKNQTIYNYLYVDAEYMEIWYGDGQDIELSKQILELIDHARSVGLEAFSKEL